MQIRLAIFLFQVLGCFQPQPWRNDQVELRLRDREPFLHAAGSMTKQDVYLETGTFQYPFQFGQISAPECILEGKLRPYVDQTFFTGTLMRCEFIHELIQYRLGHNLMTNKIISFESTRLGIDNGYILFLKIPDY